MKLREVFRLELGYQVRRPWTWVYFVALFAIILQITAYNRLGAVYRMKPPIPGRDGE